MLKRSNHQQSSNLEFIASIVSRDTRRLRRSGEKRYALPPGKPHGQEEERLHDFESLAHVKWDCKYPVVFIPKHRRKMLYGRLRESVGRILRELCEQKGVKFAGGTRCAGPCPPICEYPAEVQRVVHGRLPEGEECGADPSRTSAGATDDRVALLGHRLLGEHGRPRRGRGEPVHAGAGEAGQQPG